MSKRLIRAECILFLLYLSGDYGCMPTLIMFPPSLSFQGNPDLSENPMVLAYPKRGPLDELPFSIHLPPPPAGVRGRSTNHFGRFFFPPHFQTGKDWFSRSLGPCRLSLFSTVINDFETENFSRGSLSPHSPGPSFPPSATPDACLLFFKNSFRGRLIRMSPKAAQSPLSSQPFPFRNLLL